jgi:hypothetical protein
MVGQDAIDFLGHFAIKAPHSGLNMRHGNIKLCRSQGAGKRRIGIPVYQD